MSRSPADPSRNEPNPAPAAFFGAEVSRSRDEVPGELWSRIDDFLASRPGGPQRLIPLLHLVQKRLGYLPAVVQEHVAERLALSPIQVYAVVSFYNAFTATPRAQYEIRVCMGTTCFVGGGQSLVEVLEQACGAPVGGISDDGLFNLEVVRCIGACGIGPAVTINGKVHRRFRPAEARSLVRNLRAMAEESEGRS